MVKNKNQKVTINNEIAISENILNIIREYEFIGGQIRFKVGIINNTKMPLTNFKISFDLPKALKWIMHEPNDYERKGDDIYIPKIGINEKTVISLYLEPINCMESPINAVISFFDAKDQLQVEAMEPKIISITCPLFFTKEEANLARVKSIQKTLKHRDKKVFPISNPEKSMLIFTSILSIIGKHDIKLVNKEFSDKSQFGEAWFYGTTKVKKHRHILYVLFDGGKKILELEISADNEGEITACLAEIGNDIRQQLIKHSIISSDDKFYDFRISVLSNICPYCSGRIPAESVDRYLKGESINCIYCGEFLISLYF